MLNNFVDKVFVINLPHRTDRIKQFDFYAKKHNFDYEVFPAFDGKKLISQDFEYDGIKVGNPYMNESYFKGNVGCLISHLNLIKYCESMGFESIMVFEDDCGFVDDFNNRLDNLMTKVDDDWKMLYFGGSLFEVDDEFDSYISVSKVLTTHSYMVKRDVFKSIIENFLEKIFTSEVDVCYSDLHKKIKTYLAMPFLTFQSEGYSDIGCDFRDYQSTKKYL